MSINPKAIAGSLCALGVLLAFSFFSSSPLPPESAPEPVVALDEYGVEGAAYQIKNQPIKRHQTFSDLLNGYGVDAATINQLAEVARPVFDVRHLRAGKSLRVYQNDVAQAQLVVYQRDPVHYVVFDLRDSLQVYEGRHPVTIQQKVAGGVITSSPYQTLDEQGADPALAILLSRVFAWQVDFYRIQHGDRFQVIYEERSVDDKPVGIDRILAARFDHSGKTYYAFNFGNDEKPAFYDEAGNSLRKAFLKAPLEYSRISSRYTKRRFHPVLKRYKAHLGTDYAAPTGTPIRATGNGVVVAASYTRGNGRYVKIRHNERYTTGYLHMSRIADGIRRGVRVQQGNVIGYVGSTGLATGPHLCYRFWKKGVQVDPLKLDFGAAEPLDTVMQPAFFAYRNHFLPLLNVDAATHLASTPEDQDAPDKNTQS